MRILLIQPKISIESSFPLGLAYLTAYLNKNGGHKVEGYDLSINPHYSRLVKVLVSRRIDAIGITSMSINYNEVLEISRIVREHINAPIILGGSHPSVLPNQCIQSENIDFIVVGEGEKTVLDLIKVIEENRHPSTVNGILYKENNQVFSTNRRKPIEDLDTLPFPDRDIFPIKNYTSGMVSKDAPYTSMITSRGCTYNCAYCPSHFIWNGAWRSRSPKNVVDEMEFLVGSYGIKDIHFEDDNFALDKNRVLKICDEIVNRGLNVFWECTNGLRVDNLDSEVLKAMKIAGCRSIALGIESASPEILKKIGRTYDVRLIRNIVNEARTEGMDVCGYFMMGFPGESKDMMKETIKFSRSLDLTSAHFSVFTPLPGSALYNEMVDVRNSTRSIRASREVEKLTRLAYYNFYLRPRIIKNFIFNISNNINSTMVAMRKFTHYFLGK